MKVVVKEDSNNLRDAIIAIDAGHGGKIRAIGPRNELEKCCAVYCKKVGKVC